MWFFYTGSVSIRPIQPVTSSLHPRPLEKPAFFKWFIWHILCFDSWKVTSSSSSPREVPLLNDPYSIFFVLTLEKYAFPWGNPHPRPLEKPTFFKWSIWHILWSFGLLIGGVLGFCFQCSSSCSNNAFPPPPQWEVLIHDSCFSSSFLMRNPHAFPPPPPSFNLTMHRPSGSFAAVSIAAK